MVMLKRRCHKCGYTEKYVYAKIFCPICKSRYKDFVI